ncbi:MAG TPA: carboxypeptidase-like regulatory domain-containing protein, partial [Vicinamibacterales bacterium]|nr:carboxypeptidase-like regulatory domain-containing protein [Vicinamibacterales bacterium]
MSKWLRRGVLSLACALVFAAPAAAQGDRAQLSGRVKDAQGGSVPGVTVTATDQQTKTAAVAITDGTG